MDNKIRQNNNVKKHFCEICNYSCSKLSDMQKHLNSMKHFKFMKKLDNMDNKKSPKFANINNGDINNGFICECGKKYKHQSGLCKHKLKCNYVANGESKQPISTEMFFQLMKQNQDLQNLLLEQNKYQSEQQKQQVEQQKEHIELQKTVQEMIPKLGNNNNNTNCNNTFNVQLYLNEQCKDALNLTDFLRSLQIGMDDLLKIGDNGYSDGLSRILVNGLNNLSITERPIHCTDTKREVLYVKDDNLWEKEEEGNPKFQKSIKYLANKNEYLMKTEWAKEHPNWEEDDTNDNRAYHKLAYNMLGGTDDQETLNKKIAKKVLPEVKLDKHIVKNIEA